MVEGDATVQVGEAYIVYYLESVDEEYKISMFVYREPVELPEVWCEVMSAVCGRMSLPAKFMRDYNLLVSCLVVLE